MGPADKLESLCFAGGTQRTACTNTVRVVGVDSLVCSGKPDTDTNTMLVYAFPKFTGNVMDLHERHCDGMACKFDQHVQLCYVFVAFIYSSTLFGKY